MGVSSGGAAKTKGTNGWVETKCISQDNGQHRQMVDTYYLSHKQDVLNNIYVNQCFKFIIIFHVEK